MLDNEIVTLAEEVDEVGWSEISNGIKEEVQTVTLPQLKIAAINYLNVVNSLNEQITIFQNTLKRQQQIRRSNRSNYNEIDEYIENKQQISLFLNSEIPKRLYEESFKFQNILNEFLGQKIQMVFVYEGVNGPELYNINTMDILKFDYSRSNQLTARYKINQTQLNTSLQKLKMDTVMNFDLEGLKGTYTEALYRYRVSRSINKRIILWKYPANKWNSMRVSAEGDINEAYAAFVILNRFQPPFNKDMEENLNDFLIEGVAEVDNISGLLQGDVTANNIEYGIKSLGASALSLKQIIQIANQILAEDFDQQKLLQIKQEFQSKGRTRNKVIKMMQSEVDNLINLIQTSRKN